MGQREKLTSLGHSPNAHVSRASLDQRQKLISQFKSPMEVAVTQSLEPSRMPLGVCTGQILEPGARDKISTQTLMWDADSFTVCQMPSYKCKFQKGAAKVTKTSLNFWKQATVHLNSFYFISLPATLQSLLFPFQLLNAGSMLPFPSFPLPSHQTGLRSHIGMVLLKECIMQLNMKCTGCHV